MDVWVEAAIPERAIMGFKVVAGFMVSIDLETEVNHVSSQSVSEDYKMKPQ